MKTEGAVCAAPHTTVVADETQVRESIQQSGNDGLSPSYKRDLGVARAKATKLSTKSLALPDKSASQTVQSFTNERKDTIRPLTAQGSPPPVLCRQGTRMHVKGRQFHEKGATHAFADQDSSLR
jgi:hypothetical protein